MNILFTTGHPAQIHNFKNLKWELEKKGHHVFWIASNKEISKYLLDYYGISYTLIQRPGKNVISKLLQLLKNTILIMRFIRKHHIDLAFSRISPYVSLACCFLGKRHFALTDTETAGIYDKLFGMFVTELFTAKSFNRQLRKAQIRYDANIELFYMHPNRFTPASRESIDSLLGINKDDAYVIMRFVSWEAYHDKGLSGFSAINKRRAVKEFAKHAKVFISAECQLPIELEPFRIKIPPEKMHDVLFHASLFFGESATMASESAVLGRPAIFLNEHWFGSTNEEQDSGLLYSFKESSEDQINAINKGLDLLTNPKTESIIKDNHVNFLLHKIDVTAFFVWFTINYPESSKIIKENPDYQYNFR